MPSAHGEFDEDQARKIAFNLTKSARTNLLAVTDLWQRVTDLRPHGATGSGMDMLYVRFIGRPYQLVDRRWQPRTRRGEGYEYKLTDCGKAVQDALRKEASP